MLKRLAYPNRLEDMKLFFRRSVSALSEISNAVCLFIKDTFNHLLEDLAAHAWLNEDKFQQYANVNIFHSQATLLVIYIYKSIFTFCISFIFKFRKIVRHSQRDPCIVSN